MPVREPRSPEPRGTHTFAGALPSNRLDPSDPALTVPDPLTVTTLNATTANIGVLAALSTNITLAATIRPNASTIDIGWTGQKLRRLFVSNIGTASIRASTYYGISGNFSGTVGIGTLNVTTINATTVNGTNINGTLNGEVRRSAALDTIGETGAPFDNIFTDEIEVGAIAGNGGGTAPVSTIHVNLLDVHDELDMNENQLHGLRKVTVTPFLVDMLIGELVISDEGSSATSGRLYIKTSSGEIFGFTSTSRHTT